MKKISAEAQPATNGTVFTWRAILLFGLLLLVFSRVIIGLVTDWWLDPNYSHGFLVPLVCAFFVWRKKDQLEIDPSQPYPMSYVFVFAGLFLMVLGTAGAEYYSQRIGFVLAAYGTVTYLGGSAFARNMRFVFVYFLFAVPLPYIVYYAATMPLQTLAAREAVFVLRLIGISVAREGNILHLAGTSLEVAEACSGLRSLVSFLALGAALAYLVQRKTWKRWVLFLVNIPIAIAGNAFRVVTTGIGTVLVGPDFAEGTIHTVLGLVMFGFGLIILLIVHRILLWIGKN
jgi:exosortase